MQSTATPAPTFAFNDRVTLFSFDTYVDDTVTGVVTAFPFGPGRLVTVRADDGRTLRVDPRRVAPVSICVTCCDGCGCSLRVDGEGCGHWACWGRAASFDDADRACPGVAVERARLAAARHVRAFTLGTVR